MTQVFGSVKASMNLDKYLNISNHTWIVNDTLLSFPMLVFYSSLIGLYSLNCKDAFLWCEEPCCCRRVGEEEPKRTSQQYQLIKLVNRRTRRQLL
jgi:hypothetical protein